MTGFHSEQVAAMLSAADLNPEDWDLAELAEFLAGQRAGKEFLREHLVQTDEPALRFDPRWA